MNFASKNRTELLDFLTLHENLDNEFLAEIKNMYSSITRTHVTNIAFVQIMEDYYNDTQKYRSLLANTFTEAHEPITRMIFHKLDNNIKISTPEEFSSELRKTDSQTLKKIMIKCLFDSDEELDNEEFFDKIVELYTSRNSKYTLFKIYRNIDQYKENLLTVLDKVYPIFDKYYKKAEKDFANLIEEVYNFTPEELVAPTMNFFGSEKLDKLYSEYHSNKHRDFPENTEIAPLIMSQNRVIANLGNKNPIAGLGLQVVNINERMVNADNTRKELLKALSDDTRFEILRMIRFGFNTNKKLSKLFKISPPAITYQTNILKNANLIEITNEGMLLVKTETIEDGFDKIKSLFDITGEA